MLRVKCWQGCWLCRQKVSSLDLEQSYREGFCQSTGSVDISDDLFKCPHLYGNTSVASQLSTHKERESERERDQYCADVHMAGIENTAAFPKSQNNIQHLKFLAQKCPENNILWRNTPCSWQTNPCKERNPRRLSFMHCCFLKFVRR